MLRSLAIVVGIAIVAAMAHVVTITSGGYSATVAPLIWAAAAGLCVGSICIGVAFGERRWLLAISLFLALAAGEGYAMLTTAEATIAARDAVSMPIRKADRARSEAQKRVEEAERAKQAADGAAIEQAPLPGCRKECRALLEGAKADARNELDTARTALAALPEDRSADGLADRLHVDGTTLDLIAAGLRSLAINGLGAALIAFGAHRRQSEKMQKRFEPVQRSHATDATVVEPLLSTPPRMSAREQAVKFARECLLPSDGETPVREIRTAYIDWCRDGGLIPFPAREIAEELAGLFARTGLEIVDVDGDRCVFGAKIKREHRALELCAIGELRN